MIHKTRESWYQGAIKELQKLFHAHGYELPVCRVGCGWPTSNRKNAIGQCFSRERSADKTYEIFVSPSSYQSIEILAVLTHELCHTVAGVKAQHKKPFCELAKAIGLVKPFTKCLPGVELLDQLQKISTKLGPYPHAELTLKPKGAGNKQTTRLLKVQCPQCEYVARVTRKWLDEAGAPLCPVHKVAFEVAKPKVK